ncbi:hypothetical protein H2200_003036 [Cladophialophora chaetospira]|uniref:Protein phosphatase n=1 Tax=Cladophialophora chaetospira TaxID=386627 RepID=A0AA38XGL1_9EURO|nr:hypothetical protein H2200_003036 [Cladophialophora chaetospira]
MLVQVARSSRSTVACLFECRTSPTQVPTSLREIQRHPTWRAPYLGRRAFSNTTPLSRRYLISEGRATTRAYEQDSDAASPPAAKSLPPFYLETGYSIFAKRPSRPFPPPFVSLPSGSFSDPLTTHNPSSVPRRARRPMVNGQPVRGITNGDDAIIIGADHRFIAVNDGVGAWAQRERGHAALWSRLIAHFWDVEVEKALVHDGETSLDELSPIKSLDAAYDATKKATKGTLKRDPEKEVYSEPEEGEESDDGSSPGGTPSTGSKESSESKESSKNDILGTTTASSALLYHKEGTSEPTPVILATTLGDCKVLIIRPDPAGSASSSQSETESDDDSESESIGGTILYRSKEQWHWFDCPRQLGTNSPDTPSTNAVCDTVEDIRVGDVVAVLSDGVTDNLWEHEICQSICEGILKWQASVDNPGYDDGGRSSSNFGSEDGDAKDGVVFVARRLMNAAREIAMDPNAESPYMERALDEGIAAEGGKLDDISVVIGIVRKRE